MQRLWRLCQGLPFTELLPCAAELEWWGARVRWGCRGEARVRGWVRDLPLSGNDQKQSLNFRCSERGGGGHRREGKEGGGNERGGIIHKIVSECVKIKVKIQKEEGEDGGDGGGCVGVQRRAPCSRNKRQMDK